MRLTLKFYGLKTLKWVKNPIFSSWVKNTVRLTQIFRKRAFNPLAAGKIDLRLLQFAQKIVQMVFLT